MREQLTAGGLPFHGVAVDSDGLVVEELCRTPASIVVVTPAHQSPTGVVLSAERRRQLVDWARGVDGFVIEDDYDAEYRYDRRPIGALHGLAPDRVIYCGTTSRTLASGLRIGWLVVPHHLVGPVVARRRVTDGSTSTILQATFTAFLANGDHHRHLRRSRRVYRQRRDTIVAQLERLRPECSLSGIAAGLNVLVNFPTGTDEQFVVTRARDSGVRVHPSSSFRMTSSSDEAPGLVLGHGAIRTADGARGLQRLAAAIP